MGDGASSCVLLLLMVAAPMSKIVIFMALAVDCEHTQKRLYYCKISRFLAAQQLSNNSRQRLAVRVSIFQEKADV